MWTYLTSLLPPNPTCLPRLRSRIWGWMASHHVRTQLLKFAESASNQPQKKYLPSVPKFWTKDVPFRILIIWSLWVLENLNTLIINKSWWFGVLTVVIIESTIFWDITRCTPLSTDVSEEHRVHLHGPRISEARNQRESRCFAGFEVLTAVVMKNTIFWDITPCTPLIVNRCLGGKCRLHLLYVCWFYYARPSAPFS
jgi:hypothetical protein